MTKTFASLFSGGGGADIGAIAAGLKPVFGSELVLEIAAWYERNIGHAPLVGDVCAVDFEQEAAKMDAPLFWLHMSPPCTTASNANSKEGESLDDRAMAEACCRAIRAFKPEWVSLENVGGYQSYESYAAIKAILVAFGYRYTDSVLNSADYGVPQTRRRLILVASRTGTPVLPRPTHTDKASDLLQASMFDAPLKPWVGWYEAIADLIPTLPESKLAEWQLKRLPEELRESLLVNESSTVETNVASAPSATLVSTGRVLATKAVLLDPSYQSDKAWGSKAPRNGALDPAYTIKASQDAEAGKAVLIPFNGEAAMPREGVRRSHALTVDGSISKARAILLESKQGGRPPTLREADAPSPTTHTDSARFKAVLYDGNYDTVRNPTILDTEKPAFTVAARDPRRPITTPAIISAARVVRLTPRALARLQSFPDSYALPEERKLSGRIIGNAVPPLLMQRVIEANI